MSPRRLLAMAAMAMGAVRARPAAADSASVAVSQCIAANDEGLDLRKSGKLLEARERFAVCSMPACGSEISGRRARRRSREINAAIPTVVFAPKDPSGGDLVGVSLSIDGTPYPAPLDGNPIVLDPGEH